MIQQSGPTIRAISFLSCPFINCLHVFLLCTDSGLWFPFIWNPSQKINKSHIHHENLTFQKVSLSFKKWLVMKWFLFLALEKTKQPDLELQSALGLRYPQVLQARILVLGGNLYFRRQTVLHRFLWATQACTELSTWGSPGTNSSWIPGNHSIWKFQNKVSGTDKSATWQSKTWIIISEVLTDCQVADGIRHSSIASLTKHLVGTSPLSNKLAIWFWIFFFLMKWNGMKQLNQETDKSISTINICNTG